MNPIHFGTVYHAQGPAATYMHERIAREKETQNKLSGSTQERQARWKQRWERINTTYTRLPSGSYLLFVNDQQSPSADIFKSEIRQISEETRSKHARPLTLDRFMERRAQLLNAYLERNPEPISTAQLFTQFFIRL